MNLRKKKRGKGKISKSTALKEAHEKVMKQSKPGEGKRFASLTAALEKKGARTPKALAAWIGRRKYGAAQMAQMSREARIKAYEEKHANKRV